MRPRILSSGLELIFTPQAILPFLIGSLALAVMGNALYALATQWFGEGTNSLFGIILGALLVLLLAALVLSYLVTRLHKVQQPVGTRPPAQRQGLILLMGREEPSRKAIDWHGKQLKYCWLLFSSRTVEDTDKIEAYLRANGAQVERRFVPDVYKPLEITALINGIYAALPGGLGAEQVILDFTGMTALASVGAVLACANKEPERPIQYVPAEYDRENRPTHSLNPIEVVFAEKPVQPAPANAI